MQDLETVVVTAEQAYDENGKIAVLVKVQATSYELNVWIPADDVPKLRELRSWEEGSSQIGTSAGKPSFWSRKGEIVSVLVGTDNQCWDFGVWFGTSVLSQISEEAESLSPPAA